MADAPFPAGMIEEIEAFLEADGKRKPGLDLYDDVFKTGLFFPLQRQVELAWMMRQARSINPTTVMEIGADKGGGLYHWIKCLPTVKNVIACEIRGTPYADAFESAFPDKSFMWLPHASRNPDVRSFIKSFMGGIDCLFIDGDKGAFEEDYNHYCSVLKPGCMVFMHDVQDGSPRRAFDNIKSRNRCQTEVYIDKTDAEKALAREARGLTPCSAHEGWLRHWKGASCGVGLIRPEIK